MIVILLPGDRTSDSLKVIFPGMSMSKRWTLRWVAINSPDGEKVREVLKYFFVSVSSSGIEPPTRYVLVSEAIADRAWKEGDCSLVGGEGRRVSAYLGEVLRWGGAWNRWGDERGEVIAAIGTVEAFWQHNYLCARFGSFMNLFSSMSEVCRFVGACSNLSSGTL